MRQLKVRNFSCINSANLDFSKLTIIIGPQASGKSVLCKLSYFFMEIIHDQTTQLENQCNLDAYKEFIKLKFCEWFPPSAWGNGKFSIEFYAGSYSITLNRKIYKGTLRDDFGIRLSTEFGEQYEQTLVQINKYLLKFKSDRADIFFERDWEIRKICTKSAEKLLGKDYLISQLFIPAGRSFFTSIGKAVAAFEQGRVLDPLIIRFGRIFTAYKDQRHFFMSESSRNNREKVQNALSAILGGKLIANGDIEFIECTDGRKIPLSALSSGQQELLPIITVLPPMVSSSRKQSIFIEEPEAHLFPSAQSQLVEILSALVGTASNSLDLVMTTHSPYVLAKINNLIKAGQLGNQRSASETRKLSVQNIVPRTSWLPARAVKAYAIKNGILEEIMESDGLINSDYLDEISGEISKEFMRLLKIEIQE